MCQSPPVTSLIVTAQSVPALQPGDVRSSVKFFPATCLLAGFGVALAVVAAAAEGAAASFALPPSAVPLLLVVALAPTATTAASATTALEAVCEAAAGAATI